jgi:hypothetical protein
MEKEKFYVVSYNIVYHTEDLSNVVYRYFPAEVSGTNIHDLFKYLREVCMPHYVKATIKQHVPTKSLYFYMNITTIPYSSDYYSTGSYVVKLENIRGFTEVYERYKKLKDYIYDRRGREYYRKEEN